MSLSVKSLMQQEWILRVLADGPLSTREISQRMIQEMLDEWAERHGYAGLFEWGSDDEPVGARLLAFSSANAEGRKALHPWELLPRLYRMERAGLVARIALDGHRPILWRLT